VVPALPFRRPFHVGIEYGVSGEEREGSIGKIGASSKRPSQVLEKEDQINNWIIITRAIELHVYDLCSFQFQETKYGREICVAFYMRGDM